MLPPAYQSTKAERTGLFFVFEGLDGCGKSTQCALLSQALARASFVVVETREPTYGPYGQQIRAQFTTSRHLSAHEELALFIKDRKEHIRDVIHPALASGRIIVQDRYYLSTAAYQGSRGLDVQAILDEHATFAPWPDRIFLLELPPQDGLLRIKNQRGESPNTYEQLEGLQACKTIFDRLDVPNLIRIDAKQAPNAIHAQIWNHVAMLLEKESLATTQIGRSGMR